MSDPVVMLIDGSNLLMRCIKAMEYSGLRNGEDWQTGPLTAFIGALGRFVRERHPHALVVCWDAGPSEYRKGLYPEYKAARAHHDSEAEDRKETAFGMVKQFLRLNRIQQVAVQGYEADDVVAAYWKQCLGLSTIIVSGDKDFLQLVGRGVVQLRPDNGGGYQIWAEAEVEQKYGCPPHHLAKLMALMGDPVDGIPGVRGLGPKKALKALQEADWSLQRVSAYKDDSQRLDAELSYALACLRLDECHPDVPPVRPFAPLSYTQAGEALELVTFLRSLGMEAVLQKFYTNSLWN